VDIDAGKNILEQGLKKMKVDLSDHTDGGLSEPSERKRKLMKSEAHKSLVCG